MPEACPRDASQDLVNSPKGVVVLLHGLGVGSWLMTLLAHRLRLQGYRVVNWGYWSFWQSLDHLIPKFRERFQRLQESIGPDTPLQIVAHSMGSIITRAALADLEMPSLHRVVMLSPPNKGSFVATWVGPYLRWLTPLVDELSDRKDSYVNQLDARLHPDVEVGVIAAEWDYVLHEMSTHLDSERDHITLPSRHSGLVLRRQVAEQIVHFLDHGRFHRVDSPSETSVPLASHGSDS